MKLAALVPVLVKLQRPPPDIRIFLPTRFACSITRTRRPRWPAVSAHMSGSTAADHDDISIFSRLAHSILTPFVLSLPT